MGRTEERPAAAEVKGKSSSAWAETLAWQAP
jgi:hypothetical protein